MTPTYKDLFKFIDIFNGTRIVSVKNMPGPDELKRIIGLAPVLSEMLVIPLNLAVK